MFWIEYPESGKSLILFSEIFSLREFEDELSELGGMYMEKIQSEKGDREGWQFPIDRKESVEAFIERETDDVQSNGSIQNVEDIVSQHSELLQDLYARLQELEKHVFNLNG